MKKYLYFYLFCSVMLVSGITFAASDHYAGPLFLPPSPPCGTYEGIIIDPMEDAKPAVSDGWGVGSGRGGSGSIEVVDGYNGGDALKLTYNLPRKGAWVQFVRHYASPLNLSAGDHLRFLHNGTQPNSIEVGLISTENIPFPNYFGSGWNRATHVPWWTYATWDYKDFFRRTNSGGTMDPFPDFTQVKGIFISVVNTAKDDMGGSGEFIVDDLQIVNLAGRTIPTSSDSITVNPDVINRAANWIAAHQENGLFRSWPAESELPDDPHDYAWLYDQALALLVMVDRGSGTDMDQARELVEKLHNLQNSDGSWYAGYDFSTSQRADNNKYIGSVAWAVYALIRYYADETDRLRANVAYRDSVEAVVWLARRQRSDGKLSDITEENLDAWWAFHVTGYEIQANRVRDYLLNKVWDDDMGRFKSSATHYQIFLDNQTWGAAFLRAMGREEDARRALSYASENLVTTSSDGLACGFDGAGPFAPWNEGTAQYIAQRGGNSQYYWGQLVGQQESDGGMPGSPPPVNPSHLDISNCPESADVNFCAYIVWLTEWQGIAPTAWLYFAGTGGPFNPTVPPSPDAAPPLNISDTSTPTLTWSRVTWAVAYQVEVASQPNFSSPVYQRDNLGAEMLAVTTDALVDGIYYWRVRARRSNGSWGAWSQRDSFIITTGT